jgi:nucleoid DNA-binding protein
MNIQSWAARTQERLDKTVPYQTIYNVLNAAMDELAKELEQGGNLGIHRLGKLSATSHMPRRIRFRASTTMRARLKKQE